MKRIDLATYPRRAHFEHFLGMAYPYVGITAEVDVTDLLALCRRRKASFYVMAMHAVALAADTVPEFRRRIDQGGIVEYDCCPTSHVELKADGTYAYCTLHHHQPLNAFLSDAEARRAAVRDSGDLVEDADVQSMYFISTVPWLHYTQLIQPVDGGEDSNPRFTWGKYQQQPDGRATMPLTVQLHHALADGLHIATFYQRFEETIRRLCDEE